MTDKCCLLVCFAVILILSVPTSAYTDITDVQALQDIYVALNSPQQLKRWRSISGDPCEDPWEGISCNGSSVIHIKIANQNLTGFLGYQLANLINLKQLDVSYNNIEGEIPYSLPPRLTHLEMAFSNFSNSIPYSLSPLKFLSPLNLSHNSLSGSIENIFTSLTYLREMDLSYNNLTGDLPSSFGSLIHLTKLNLSHNSFSGSVGNVFTSLTYLREIDLSYNNLTGDFPSSFGSLIRLTKLSLQSNEQPSILIVLFVICVGATVLFLGGKWRRKRRFIRKATDLVSISLEDLSRATNARMYVVKTMNITRPNRRESEIPFNRLTKMLSRLKHPNILKLVGTCVEQGEHHLVFEYVRNFFVSDALTQPELAWLLRISIAIDIARGIEYMHCVCRPPVAHGGLNATNIYLDQNFRALISECGFSMMDPARNYLDTPLEVKLQSDKEALGEILFKLLTGTDFDRNLIQPESLEHIEGIEEIINLELKFCVPRKAVLAIGRVLLDCFQENSEMKAILDSLENVQKAGEIPEGRAAVEVPRYFSKYGTRAPAEFKGDSSRLWFLDVDQDSYDKDEEN